MEAKRGAEVKIKQYEQINKNNIAANQARIIDEQEKMKLEIRIEEA